jgi:DNA-binding GntR family transcriptional regulator
VRVLLEPFALQKAVPRMDDDHRSSLFSMLDDADVAARREDLYLLSGLNRTFHDALIARCDNGRIIETVGQIQDQLRAIALRSWMLAPTYAREAEQHRMVAEAVASGDAARAADLLRNHIVGFEEHFVRTFGPQDDDTG